MKEKKSLLLLTLYNDLMENKGISKKDWSKEHNISERSFFRYLNDIRLFLKESHAEGSIVYFYQNHTYRYVKKSKTKDTGLI